ncbi:MAG: hypothetical protein ACRDFC_06260 [Ignavibacteria bacterium]
MKKILLVILLYIISLTAFSQSKEELKSPFLKYDKSPDISNPIFARSGVVPPKVRKQSYSYFKTNFNQNKEIKSKKSPGLAFLYSLLVPGMGQLYTKRFDVGKYFLIAETSLWLGFAAFTVYGNWLFNDASAYAVYHAGIIENGKDKDFFINIGNYDNVDRYNDEMLRLGEYDKVYYPGTGYDFYWDTIENRRRYREDYLSSERIHNDRLFIVGAVLLNHVVSAVSALILTNKYNSELKKGSGGISLSAGILKDYYKVHGLKLKFTKWF